MSRELTHMESFQEKVKQRLKKDIADLLPDEVMKQLVQTAVHDMFFMPREVKDGYHRRTEPSWFNVLVREATQDIIRHYVLAYMQENREQFDGLLRAKIVECVPNMVQNFQWQVQELMEFLKSNTR